MKNIALIPARSGSKGFKNKNIAKISGKTLIELAVKVGLDAKQVDDVFISTDSEQYEQIAKDAGAKSMGLRSEHLAGDKIKTIDVVLDFIQQFPEQIENLILLQPTSPIRTPEQIDNMLCQLTGSDNDGIVSVEKVDEPHPYKMKIINDKGFITEFVHGTSSEVPRQLLPDVFKLTGSIYINRIKSLENHKTFLPVKTIGYVTGKTINIDNEDDFILLESLHKRNRIVIYGT
jgi:CMP-N,N'-diacetyllegionaminic acid synthase